MSVAGHSRLIVALDFDHREAADALVRHLDPALCRLKVGNELFTRAGPACVERWQRLGFEVFLDLKFHDIPNTVAAACRAAADLGAWMVNVHAQGGPRMLAAARAALGDGADRPLLTAVTVLTSMDADDLAALGLGASPAELTLSLAAMAQEAGCDGVVCSAREAAALRAQCGRSLLLVTPGIRPRGSGDDDQRRTMSPAEALSAGADYLVVGRPITASADPVATLRELAGEIDRAAPA